MAQSLSSQTITHCHNNHRNLPPNLNQSNHNHNHNRLIQHNNSIHGGNNLSHPNNPHSTPSSSHNQTQKPFQNNDDEAIARKKKNADAQAAFRQRRQTYIKSLEDTVAELKNAVTEMEAIVKTTSNEAKIQRQQVEYLQAKLNAYDSGDLKPGAFDSSQHCKCCKFAVQDFTPRLPTPSSSHHHHPAKSLPVPSTSAITINTTADCPTPSGPSIVTPQESVSRDWPSRQAIPSIYQPGSNSRSASHSAQESSNDPPNSAKALDCSRNIHHHSHSSNSLTNPPYPRPNCDLNLFSSFGGPENTSISSFYSERNHGTTTQSSGHCSSPAGLGNSLELAPHSAHLQPEMGHSYDRSPPLRQTNSIGASYSPLGPQSFDGHHSESNSAANLGSSPKSALYSMDGSLADAASSGFRLHHGINERSIMRPVDYLPSLELKPLPSSYPIMSSLASPVADSAFASMNSKNRLASTFNKRRREWGDDKFVSNLDTHEMDDGSNLSKSSGVGKPNGLPAKVARCEQTVVDVTKVVIQAKEEAKAMTTTTTTTPTTTRHSNSSTNCTVSNTFSQSPNPSQSTKFQRMKLNGTPHQLGSTPALLSPQSQSHT